MTTLEIGGYIFKYNLGSGIAIYEPGKINADTEISAPEIKTHEEYEKKCERWIFKKSI